ncbi:MAG: PorT family protein [Prevotella sp.]|nr:PorT family protein [Prevotella sp.]
MKKMMMIAAMMLMSMGAFAQNAIGQLTIKPMVGMTLTTITGGNADMKVGLAAGAEVEYGIADKFGLTGGLIYSMQGAKYTPSGSSVKVTTNLDYINIPILANYYVYPGLAIKAGLQPGFNVRGKTKTDAGNSTQEVDSNAKTVDFSIPFGISYQFSDFVIDARYNLGLTNTSDGGSSKNSVFMFSVGYKFEL